MLRRCAALMCLLASLLWQHSAWAAPSLACHHPGAAPCAMMEAAAKPMAHCVCCDGKCACAAACTAAAALPMQAANTVIAETGVAAAPRLPASVRRAELPPPLRPPIA